MNIDLIDLPLHQRIQFYSEEDKIEFVKERKENFKNIPNPSKAITFAAVEAYPYNISLVENPSDDLLRLAISKSPSVVEIINFELPKELQFFVVKLDPYKAITVMRNPCEEVLKIAVKKHGYFLKFIPEEKRTAEIQEIAVKSYPLALEYCINPSRDLIMYAISRNASTIQFIEDQDLEMQQLAIRKNLKIMCYIVNPSDEIIMFAALLKK